MKCESTGPSILASRLLMLLPVGVWWVPVDEHFIQKDKRKEISVDANKIMYTVPMSDTKNGGRERENRDTDRKTEMTKRQIDRQREREGRIGTYKNVMSFYCTPSLLNFASTTAASEYLSSI